MLIQKVRKFSKQSNILQLLGNFLCLVRSIIKYWDGIFEGFGLYQFYWMSLEGNKPKKLVRKTNLHNPSLQSFNVTSLFNPELYNYFVNTQLQQLSRKKLNIYQKHQQQVRRKPQQQLSPPQVYRSQQLDKNRSRSLLEREDSLQKAKKQYNQQKGYNFNPNNKYEPLQYQSAQRMNHYKGTQDNRTTRQNELFRAEQDSYTVYNRRLNYLDTSSIKTKQLHGYNILSGF